MKKISLILALFLLFEIGYANDHFRDRIDRVLKNQETGSNFLNFEQALPANANWTSTFAQASKQTSAQNINEYDMLLQGTGMGVLNCIDIGATGTLSESILYKRNYFYTPGSSNYYIDSVEYTFYNSQLTELFKLMIRTNHLKANDVRIIDFSYQLFTTNSTRREFLVLIHHFSAPSYSTPDRRFDYMVIDEQGTHLHTFADANAIQLYRNGNVRKVITVDRPEVLDQVLTNSDTTLFRVWNITAGANAPASVSLQATHKIGSKNLVGFDAPLWEITQIGSNYYYYFPYYEQPYYIGTPAQGFATPNNTGIVDLYNISNSTLFKKFEMPMPNWTEAMMLSLGIGFEEFDFTTNVFSNDGKVAIFYGLKHYLPHCDCFQSTYHVMNEDGVMLRNMETKSISVKRLADVPGQNPLYSLATGTGENVSKFIMFDPIEWELGTEFEAIHNGERLTLNYERIRYGDDYAIIFGMDALITENGTKYGQINYYDKNGQKIRNIKLNIGPLGLAFSPMFSPATLNPYLFNADGKIEFLGIAPRRVQEGSDVVTLRLFIFNEDSELLYFAEDGANILSGAGIWTFDRGRTYSYFSLKYRNSSWVYTDYLFKLPFTIFTEGDGTTDNPYLISDVGQLNAVRNNLSAHYKIVNDINMEPWLLSQSWTPIGTPSAPFTGTLDGQNFTIKNLKLENISGTYSSLFGVVRGKIENLRIEDAEIIANNTNVSFMASLMEQSAIIRNVHVTGAIKLGTGVTNVGVIVADMNGAAGNHAKVEQCSFDGIIETMSGIALTNVHTGGIAGSLRNSNVINCLSKGRINVTNGAAANAGVGGIVGSMRSNCLISNCYSMMDVAATNMAGGVVGRADEMQQVKGTIENSYATGRIIARGTTNGTFAGGVIGWSSDNNAHIGFDSEWNLFLQKTKLTMGGLVALNDTVSAIAASSTVPSDLPRRARRVVGINTNAAGNMTDFGAMTADSIKDCYALATMAVGQAGRETTIVSTNPLNHDGSDLTPSDFTQGFLAGMGWNFGNNAQNPWVWIEGAYPKLWFEVAVQSVTLDAAEITLYVDDTHQLTATVLPEYALNKNVTWTSSNVAIATVEEGLITATSIGTAIITVATEDGGFMATCTVNVVREEHVLTLQARPAEGGNVTGGGTFYHGETATIAAVPNSEYEFVNWTKNDVEITREAFYSFEVTETVTLVANFKKKQGIADINATNFTIYPNPVSDILRVDRSTTGNVRIEIYNSLGTLLQSLEMKDTKAQINVTTLPSGIYFIRFIGDQTVSTKRFVKE